MRLKFVFALVTSAAALLVIVYFVSTTPQTTVTDSQPATQDASALTPAPERSSHINVVAKSNPSTLAKPQDEFVEMDNAMLTVNEQTLPLLCAKLRAVDRQVRQAAISNLVVLADRDAIVALSEAADRSTDSDEKTNILKAIEFLQLPTYDELVANGTMSPLGKSPNNANRLELEQYSHEIKQRSPTGESK
jgi:mannitol-specific phosphotransferase system IIBC component